MKLGLKLALAVGVLTLAAAGSAATAHHGGSTFRATLSGYEEAAPPQPTLSSSATGTFRATINDAGNAITYTETYTGPFDANSAGGNVTQSHIHFGARAISGGVSAFLCTNLGNGPAGTPLCPSPSGTVSGTITAAQVVGPNGQGIAPGQFDELVRAMRAGFTYVNVHTSTFPAGEIRGQISGGDEDDDD